MIAAAEVDPHELAPSVEECGPSAAASFLEAWAAGWAPDPLVTVSAWADRYRYLSRDAGSPEPGPYDTARTPYVREIADCFSVGSEVEEVVFLGSVQLGKSEVLLNVIGYTIHQAPAGILLVYPNEAAAKRVSQTRIDPMIEHCAPLRERIRDRRVRDAGNTVFLKQYPGGHLALAGANAGAGLRSASMSVVLLDEVDAYREEIEREGDPIGLAVKRQRNFWRRKTYWASTPTVKGASRIETEYLNTDQRRYFLPCPECGAWDWLRWENVRWTEGAPETARVLCVPCQALIDHREKERMLAQGEWRPTASHPNPRRRGYQLSTLYSPWVSWAELAREWLAAQGKPPKLREFFNLSLGQTYEERVGGIDHTRILDRGRPYFGADAVPDAEIPHGVGGLTAAVDVQEDRLEVVVKGWGAGEESWLIAWDAFQEDPKDPAASWAALDEFLGRPWLHESGRRLRLSCVCIDSNYRTETVYEFVAARLGRSIFPIRGGFEVGKPLVGRPSKNNRYGLPLWTLCTDTGKETVYERLAIEKPGPGYCHFPEWVDREYAEQLTAEVPRRKYVPGRGLVRVWVKRRPRNEALDLEVYATAAVGILGPAWVRALPEWAERHSRPPDGPLVTEGTTAPAATAPRGRRPAGGGWVRGTREPWI